MAVIIQSGFLPCTRPNLDDEGISDKTDSDLPLRPALYVEYEWKWCRIPWCLPCLPVKIATILCIEGDRVVVAEFAIHSADSVDSVWVKLAHSQDTRLDRGAGNDARSFCTYGQYPHNSFYLFDDTHASYFVIIFALFCRCLVFRLFRRKQLKIIYFRDNDECISAFALPVDGIPVLHGVWRDDASFVPETLGTFLFYNPCAFTFQGAVYSLGLFATGIWFVYHCTAGGTR